MSFHLIKFSHLYCIVSALFNLYLISSYILRQCFTRFRWSFSSPCSTWFTNWFRFYLPSLWSLR